MFFDGITDKIEAKRVYRELVIKHHPDRGGDEETMKLINAEYDKLTSDGGEWFDVMDGFSEIIKAVSKFTDITVELCGSWLWISGNTKEHKEELKGMGCKFSAKKAMWFWYAPNMRKYRTRHAAEMDEIRYKYGSRVVHGQAAFS